MCNDSGGKNTFATYSQIVSPNCIARFLFGVCAVFLVVKSFQACHCCLYSLLRIWPSAKARHSAKAIKPFICDAVQCSIFS